LWVDASLKHVLVELDAVLQLKQHDVTSAAGFVEARVHHSATDLMTIFHQVGRISERTCDHDLQVLRGIFVAVRVVSTKCERSKQ